MSAISLRRTPHQATLSCSHPIPSVHAPSPRPPNHRPTAFGAYLVLGLFLRIYPLYSSNASPLPFRLGISCNLVQVIPIITRSERSTDQNLSPFFHRSKKSSTSLRPTTLPSSAATSERRYRERPAERSWKPEMRLICWVWGREEREEERRASMSEGLQSERKRKWGGG